MDIIELTRQLGAEIQKDERYLKFHEALEANEKDEELNKLIGEFNLLRVSLGNEASKEEKDNGKIEALNKNLEECYGKIMANDRMKAFEEAKNELDHLIQDINAIIMMSVEGEDPATCDPHKNCGGECSTCGGCH
jgi:cell fate (sporulation/competence/biofilm development) regulator YlbF (YheA/YmcA/DUF963 family)